MIAKPMRLLHSALAARALLLLLLARCVQAFWLQGCPVLRRPYAGAAAHSAHVGRPARERAARMSVGHSVDGSPTVDGSGKFDPVRVVSPHDDGASLLWVVPAGALPPSDGTKSVSLLPGFGWGEGTHPSTYMCLQYICDETAARPGCSVMDYGTGSGVLALAAGAMGAQRVIGVDKDEEILEHAMENVEHNSLASVSVVNGREVMVGSEGLYIGDDHRAASFNVTVANMLPAALCKLSSAIAMSVAEDAGVLALCGCNRDEVPSVKAAFVKAGIEFTGERSKLGAAAGAEVKEYVLLMGRRPRRFYFIFPFAFHHFLRRG